MSRISFLITAVAVLAIMALARTEPCLAFSTVATSAKSNPAQKQQKVPLFQPARVISGAATTTTRGIPPLFLSSSEPSEDGSSVTTEGKKPMPTSGTYYDDEVDPIPTSKVGISESMKDRLIREASTGMDSEQKQTNVLLYIIAAVGVLVLLGGKDVLY